MQISLEAYEKLLDRIEELRAENDKLWESTLSAEQWINVKNRLPKDGERVLVWLKPSVYKTEKDSINIAVFSRGEFYFYVEHRDGMTNDIITIPHRIDCVSYWMLLPEPPEGKKCD